MSSTQARSSDSKPALKPKQSESYAQSELKNQLAQECQDVQEDFQALVQDVSSSIRTYCRRRPQMAGLMIFAIGFYVGWKIKPW